VLSASVAVHANAIAADVHRHRVSSHSQLGYNRTKLTSLIYNHEFQIDPRPVRVVDSCFPVQLEFTIYEPVSLAKFVDVGVPLITTKSTWVNFPFPSKVVMATPFWGRTVPAAGRSSPEMVCPFLPLSVAFEHPAACATVAPPSARQVSVAARVALQIQVFMFCFFVTPQNDKFPGPWGLEASVGLGRGADCRNPAALAMARA